MNIEERARRVAQAEAKAEAQKSRSETTWRSKWWDTTLFLAEPEGQTAASEVLSIVAIELGQSKKWLGSRRRTGKIIKSALECRLVDLAAATAFPPRLAVAWVDDLKRDTEGMIDALEAAMRDETSLREFIAAHGGVPMSTGKERFTPQPRAEPTAPPTREERVNAAREALADEDVAKEVMRDTKTAINASRASREAAVSEHEARQRDRDIADPKAAKDKAEDREQVGRMMARVNLESFLRHAKRDGISALSCWGEIQGLASQVDRDLLVDVVEEALNPLRALQDALRTNHNIDAELAAFLAQGDE